MSDQEILQRAIEKAMPNGWQPEWLRYFKASEMGYSEGIFYAIYDSQESHWHVNEVIFNHDFARALWGENEVVVYSDAYEDNENTLPAWQFHLQQMVIAENPIKYLGENL